MKNNIKTQNPGTTNKTEPANSRRFEASSRCFARPARSKERSRRFSGAWVWSAHEHRGRQMGAWAGDSVDYARDRRLVGGGAKVGECEGRGGWRVRGREGE